MLDISTADGVAEAIVATPPGGSGPGVLFFMDGIGLRPRIEEMVEQIASWGYVVMAPNLYYRDGTVSELGPTGDLTTAAGRDLFFQVAGPRMGNLTTERTAPDVDAYVSALHALPGVSPGPVGVVGFCLGVRFAVRAAGRHPELVAACAGFHGGRLVTDDPDSPHLDLATAKAEFVFGHADNDGSMTLENAESLAAVLAEAGLTAKNEIYEGAAHGYTMAVTWAWDEASFERAFANLHDLYDRTLR
jgi:carboxymethylenebutenolidase